MKSLTLILLAASLTLGASAQQRRGRGYTQLMELSPESNHLRDSIDDISNTYSARLDSMCRATRRTRFVSSTQHPSDNPYYFPLFAGATLLQSPLHRTIGSISASAASPAGGVTTPPSASISPSALDDIAWAVVEAYASHPEFIRMNLAVPSLGGGMGDGYYAGYAGSPTAQDNILLPAGKSDATTRKEASQAAQAPVEITKGGLSESSDEWLDFSDFHIHVRRPNFWKVKGSFSTQFMQYYVSDNWYKGGEDHVSMLASFIIEANYDNKQKLTFANKLETKLGFQTSPSDTYHHFKTNADLLRLTDKLGVQASKHWYYTVMLQSWTQFYKAYKSNSPDVTSGFLSPFESVLSIGMDYKLQKKRVNLTATLSPAAANMKCCRRSEIVNRYGIDEGKHCRFDLGSTVTVNMTFKFCEQVNWVSRFYAFYDYKNHLKAEWENTVNLRINKYLSTKLFLYPRFDNNVQKKNEDDSYFQFNEYLSVGLDLNF